MCSFAAEKKITDQGVVAPSILVVTHIRVLGRLLVSLKRRWWGLRGLII